MNLRQIENILTIAEEKNITKAAEKLYISQPALNQQLLNLEKELGTPLFQRKRREWEVTEAGEIYLEAGRRILNIKKDAYARIADAANTKREELNIGVTPGMGDQILNWIFRRFYRSYPDVQMHIVQGDTVSLRKSVIQGNLDIGIGTVSSCNDTDRVGYRELKSIETLVIVSEKNPLVKKAYQEADGSWCVDIRGFQEEPFALGAHTGTNGEIQQKIFEEAGFSPRIYQEGGGRRLRISMVELDLCCSFLEEHYINELPTTVRCFKLSSHPKITWVAIYRKNSHLSKAARFIMELAEQYWKER